MQVTKGTWHMCEQCVPGSLSSSPAQESGNEAMCLVALGQIHDFSQAIFSYFKVMMSIQ